MPADAPAALSWIDIAIVMTYLVGIVLLGLWVSRGIHTSKDLFLAGKSLPWWAVGLSLVVSDIGAKDMVGLAADGYRFGAVMMNFDFIGCIFPVLIAAFIFMPYFWLSGIYTVPEYLGRRYNQSVRTIFALLWGVFMVGNVAIIFVSAAVMFESLLGWSFEFAVVLTAVVAGLITTAGGLRAVVITEFVSCIILIVGAALICIYGLQRVGGWSGLQTSMAEIPWAENHFDLIRPADDPSGFGWPAVLLGLGFVLGPSYWIGNQAIAQRALGSKSPGEARASYVFCALIKLFFPLLLVLPGIIGVVLYHERVGVPKEYAHLSGEESPVLVGEGSLDANNILPELVRTLLPPGILGLVLGAFLAGVISNLDSYLNSASTMWVTDIYRPFLRPRSSDHECMRLGQILVVVILFIAAGSTSLIRTYSSVFEAFQTLLSYFQGATFALLLFGMLTRWATSAGGVAGMIAGVGTAIFLNHAGDFELNHLGFIPLPKGYLWVSWWAFVVAVLALVLVSWSTRRYSDEQLRGLVYWLPQREGGSQESEGTSGKESGA